MTLLRTIGLWPKKCADILGSRKHSVIFSAYRAEFLLSRIYIAASVFVLLTPFFAVANFVFLPYFVAESLSIVFSVCDLFFIALAIFARRSTELSAARLAVFVALYIPTLFFVVVRVLLAGQHFDASGQALGVVYAFSPFVFVSFLALFPLVVLEISVFIIPMLLIFLFSDFFHLAVSFHNGIIFTGMKDVGLSVLLLLIAMVSSMAALSQLKFMQELFEKSAQDPLTHLWNRRSGELFLQQQMAYSIRHNQPLSVVFLDMDNFKKVNDIFGHKAGDQVLLQAAEQLNARLRRSDAFIRWGGEEFLIVLTNTTVDDAYHRLVFMTQESAIHRPDDQRMTWSGGISQWPNDPVEDWEALVKLADDRMYRAKQAGKDRIYFE